MGYSNINNPVNYQLQGFGQNGVRTISTDQLYIQGEYYRVLVAEEDSYVTAVSVLGDDLTAEFVYAGTTIYGLFTEVSVSSGSLTAYIAGTTDIEDVWAYINTYGQTNAARIEAADCAKDAIAPLLDKYYAKASLVMVPSLYKTSIVYSERPLTTDGQLAFTRSNDTATRVGPDGLIEKVRTNLVRSSGDISTQSTYWTSNQSGSTTQNAAVAPDGTTTASQITSAGSSFSGVQQGSISVAAVPHTYSCYLKAVSGTPTVRLTFYDGVTFHQGNFTITSEWVRYSFTFTPLAVSFAVYNTCSSVATWLAWGAMLETGDIATDYIATTTAPVSVGPVANVPRLDYSGGSSCPRLLLEPQRTNLALWSESFDNAGWTKLNATISANAATSPDGYTNADSVIENTATGAHLVQQAVGGSGIATYAVSVFGKSLSGDRFLQLWMGNTVNSASWARFDLVNGLVTQSNGLAGTGYSVNSATIENYGNGWYRCTFSANKLNTTGNNTIQYRLSQISTGVETDSYLGNGTSGIRLYGAQVESGASYSSSYVNTLGAAVTRGADAASKTGISSLIGQTQGTLFAEVDYSTLSGLDMFLSIRPNASNKVEVYRDGANIYGEINGSSNFAIFTSKAVGTHKIAFAYKSGSSALYIDGALVSQNTTSFTFSATLADLFINQRSGGAFIEAANYKQALLFKTRLTDQELQDLTTL